MEKEFVPYELAVKLEELGFDKKCIATIDQTNYIHIKGTRRPIRGAMVYNTIDCPTFSQAFRWFRDNYNLYHTIDKQGYWFFEIKKEEGFVYLTEVVVFYDYNSYEEAEIACLEKLIELTFKSE